MAFPIDRDQTSVQNFIDAICDAARDALQTYIATPQGLRRVVRDTPINNLADALHVAANWALRDALYGDAGDFDLDKWIGGRAG